MLKLTGIASLMICAATLAQACGGADDACETESGTYHISRPDNVDGPLPVVMFLHGYGGHGMASQNNQVVGQNMRARGYAVISPNALMGQRATSWNFHPEFNNGRDEAAFFTEVLTDAASRNDLDMDRVLLAGFSLGGSMTSYIACNSPDDYAAFAPVAGSFWRPEPESCDQPMNLFHTHGWRDTVVPIEGREVGSGFIQGNVFTAFETLRLVNGCAQPHATTMQEDGVFMRRRWDECAPDTALELALFPGGHTVPDGWADMVIDWFENLP